MTAGTIARDRGDTAGNISSGRTTWTRSPTALLAAVHLGEGNYHGFKLTPA